MNQIEERIIKTDYSEVMQKSYIDYAMSVIVARALPDIRDGLKPVQRRTLYDMHELGIKFDKPYRKSARIVGDTMGKYHPHGDSSIYESLVVMTQDFKKGLPLVDGHGNFGNIEGDGAAAMRYTEARLEEATQIGLLADLDKDIVDFVPNFDETEKEPEVLPAKFPNLLVNGAEGIAVGMATSIPPHNLAEVINATKAYMKNPEITTSGLMKYIKGPDFPTGGIIINQDELLNIYETGSGKVKIRGKVDVEQLKGGKINVVISQIPYTMIGAGIGKFLSDVANLAETKKTNDIIDISNQTSKEGIRIVIELKKDTNVDNFINMLYKKTKLEDTFGVNMLSIREKRPETLGIKEIIKANVDFQYEVNTRKYNTLLDKELEKKEIEEGLIKACNVIDLIIEILRGSKDRAMVKKCLVEGDTTNINFKSKSSEIMAAQLRFSEKQANAILDMRLYKLIGLEIEALLKSHEQTLANIYRYEDILASKESMMKVLVDEMDEIKSKFKRDRRTLIENAQEAVYVEEKIKEMDEYCLIDKFGYIHAVDTSTFERNKETILSENVHVFLAKNTGKIALFTKQGNLHSIKVSEVPFGKLRDKSIPIDNISTFNQQQEDIIYVDSLLNITDKQILFFTKEGLCKIVESSEFDVAKRLVAATKLSEGDEVVHISLITNQMQVIIQTQLGSFLRFPIDQIPMKKKAAVGVRAIRLKPKDFVEEIYYVTEDTLPNVKYNEKNVDYLKIKLSKRDGASVKLRL